jgi:hypothetical protein
MSFAMIKTTQALVDNPPVAPVPCAAVLGIFPKSLAMLVRREEGEEELGPPVLGLRSAA